MTQMFSPARDQFDSQSDPIEVQPHPQVFTRIFTTPPGLPWEQSRAAQLEARHGSPLPINELMYRLKRLGTWAFGQPARYAVFYMRLREFKRPFETTLEVDGQPVKVMFGTAEAKVRQARTAGFLGAICVASVAIAAGGVTFALSARDEGLARLEAAEQRATAKARVARMTRQRADQAEMLRRQVGSARPVAEVVADLAWAGGVRAPDARIVAIHWDHGLLALEARGETAPILVSNGTLQRSPEPLRKGVWLWGVSPPGREPAGRGGPP